MHIVAMKRYLQYLPVGSAMFLGEAAYHWGKKGLATVISLLSLLHKQAQRHGTTRLFLQVS